jgi:predicted exporter
MVTLVLNGAAFLFLAFIALWLCIGIGIVFATIFDNGHEEQLDAALAPDWTP